MKADNDNLIRRPSLFWRILAWVDYVVVGAVVIVVLAIWGITLWLTPERLSEIVDREASKRINADVHTGDISFTFWSTFPHFCIVADSIHIDSRNLKNLPADVRSQLPANPDFLLSTGRMEGGINIAKLMRGQIWLKDVVVDSLRLNLVAVNDSLNNYDIVPSTGKSHVPYFNIDKMSFVDGGNVSYYSLISDTKASIALSAASLTPASDKNDYHLMFKGKVFAKSGGLDFLRGFPFELDGNVNFRFKPNFGVSASDYIVNLGSLKGQLGMDLDVGEDVKLNKFDYHIQDFTLDDVRSFIPLDSQGILKRLDADVQLEASARLTSPYNFSSGYLPSAEVDFFVPSGSVGYTFADNRRYAVDNVDIAGRFVFNGYRPEESFIEVPRLNVSGYGAELKASAKVTNLTNHPRISMEMDGRGDLDKVSGQLAELRPYKMSGTADFKFGLKFDIDGSSIRESQVKFSVKSDNMQASFGGYNFILSGFEASTGEKYGDALTMQATKNNIPLQVKLTADKASVSNSQNKDVFSISSLKADAKMSAVDKKSRARKLALSLSGAKADLNTSAVKANINNPGLDYTASYGANGLSSRSIGFSFLNSNLSVNTSGLKADLNNVSLDFSADYLNSAVVVPDFKQPASWSADKETMGRVNHTPEFVRVPLPQSIKDMINRWRISFGFKSGDGRMDIDGYPVKIGGVDLKASLDSVEIRNLNIAHGSTRGNLSASVSNLRQFLVSNTPAPLRIDANVALDTVQINQLARDFTATHPNSAIARGDKAEMGDGNDTLTIMLPRNIDAKIHATAIQTRYTNLHLYDLSTDVMLNNGIATVDTLHISSDFGQASLKLMYDTSDLQALKVTTGFRFYDVNVVGFFQNFPKLLSMWPEMKNLSGTLSIGLDGRLYVFPNMNINMPSLWANANINGYNLKLNQNHFIKHLAHMLLIFQDGPIDIEDLNLQAHVHSNLVELFPTTFEVSKYKLILMGLNNFNGDLYYHVGVENWPLKIPFGVNIKGHYHHPVLRFGGKDWKDRNGAMITGGVQDNFNFNLVHSVKHYTGEFIHSAASYEE